MKKVKSHIEQRTNETLKLIDSYQKVKASPFFNTRLQARLEKETESKNIFSFAIPILKPIVISLILINVITLSFIASDYLFTSHSENIETMSELFYLDTNSELLNIDYNE